MHVGLRADWSVKEWRYGKAKSVESVNLVKLVKLSRLVKLSKKGM